MHISIGHEWNQDVINKLKLYFSRVWGWEANSSASAKDGAAATSSSASAATALASFVVVIGWCMNAIHFVVRLHTCRVCSGLGIFFVYYMYLVHVIVASRSAARTARAVLRSVLPARRFFVEILPSGLGRRSETVLAIDFPILKPGQ